MAERWTLDQGPALLRHLNLRLPVAFIVANGIGAGLAVLNLSGPAEEGSSAPLGFSDEDITSFFVLAAYFVLVAPVASILGRRRGAVALAWLQLSRAPTTEERARLLRLPAVNAMQPLIYWGGGAVLFAVLNAFVYDSPEVVPQLTFGIMLGGLTTAAVMFLIGERVLRPAFAVAFAHGGGDRTPVGIGPRLMLTWGLASVVPLVSIALIFLAGTGTGSEALIAIDIVVGLAVGFFLMRSAARSVSEPLSQLRSALGSVQAGDLTASADITDGGEIGLLQSGFNRMVDGLRERERLQTLFGRHVGEDVARRALDEGIDLGGERREATAMFIDVVGSTSMALQMAPEQVVERLNAFFGAVVRCVHDNGGIVNKFEGDGALCIFGAPRQSDDHARHALRAARALRAEIDALGERFPGLDAAIGISSGVVVAGNVGAEDRLEYTIIGDPVNEAARLTDEAKSRRSRVLASARTVDAAQEAEGWEPGGSVVLRGRDAPTEVFELGG